MSVNQAVESYQLDPAVAERLRQGVDRQCERAAQALAEADVLLVVTGAGFSADSGLAVFNDVAKIPAYRARGLDYWDVSQPKWIDKDPATFYGFWGQMFNDYRATAPHAGYDIVSSWRHDKMQRPRITSHLRRRIARKVKTRLPFDDAEVQRLTPYDANDEAAGAFFLFTSNCDGHSYDYFPAHEIHDCHGSVELWQCSNREDCDSGLWRAPLDHTFVVDKATMLAPESAVIVDKKGADNYMDMDDDDNVARVGHAKGSGKERTNLLQHMPPGFDTQGWLVQSAESANWPRCGHCHSLARPGIFMFGDFGWKYDRSQEIRWDYWKESLLELANGDGDQEEDNDKEAFGDDLKVCIVEVGCGLRIPTCRNLSENLVTDLLRTTRSSNGVTSTSVHLVRINPDFPTVTDGSVPERNLIPILSRGLDALRKIDELYHSLVTDNKTGE